MMQLKPSPELEKLITSEKYIYKDCLPILWIMLSFVDTPQVYVCRLRPQKPKNVVIGVDTGPSFREEQSNFSKNNEERREKWKSPVRKVITYFYTLMYSFQIALAQCSVLLANMYGSV